MFPLPTVDRSPVWQDGFALDPSESKFPFMWYGMIGEYAMSVGPGGDVVTDLSQSRRDGITSGIHVTDSWLASDNPRVDGWSLDFDGDQDYVQLPWYLNTNIYSSVAWVKISAQTGIQAVFDNRDAMNDGTVFAINGSEQLFLAYNSTQLNGNTTLQSGEWYHLACTSDGNTLRGYVNGRDDGSVSISGSISVSTNIRLGARNFSVGNVLEWYGEMQEVRFYDRVLSAEEILLDYLFPLSPLIADTPYMQTFPPAEDAHQFLTLLGVT